MRTETRSAAETLLSPRIWLTNFRISHFSSPSPPPPSHSWSYFPIVPLEMDVAGGHNGGHSDSRVSIHASPRPLLVTYSLNFTFPGAPTSELKFKPSPTANTRSRSAMSTNFVPSSVSPPSQISKKRSKNANESRFSPFYSFMCVC